MNEAVHLEGEFVLTGRSIEFLDESLREIKGTVEQIATVLFRSNGHSIVSRIALLEQAIESNTMELEKIQAGTDDSKTKLAILELKNWQIVSIIVSVVLSLLAQILIRKLFP